MAGRVFWRVHWSGRETFSASEARSHLWGDPTVINEGYSCCRSAEDLCEYFASDDQVDGSEDVVVFTGREVGVGDDGEPLAVPTGPQRWLKLADVWRSVSEPDSWPAAGA